MNHGAEANKKAIMETPAIPQSLNVIFVMNNSGQHNLLIGYDLKANYRCYYEVSFYNVFVQYIYSDGNWTTRVYQYLE